MSNNKPSDELKQHQIADIYKADDIPFKDISTHIAKRLVNFGLLLFGILLILSFVIKIPREINLSFELKGGLSEHIYQYPETVYLRNFYVNTFDKVDTGSPLVSITSPRIVSYLEAYKTAKNQLDLFNNSKRQANEKAISLLNRQASGILSELDYVKEEKSKVISASEKETKNLELQLQNRQNQHNRNKQLHDNQVISDQELEESLILLHSAEQELISTKEDFALQEAEVNSRLQELRNEYDQTTAEIEQKEAEFEFEHQELKEALRLSKNMMELNYGPFKVTGNAITLISNIKGQVNLKTETENEIEAGEIILRIQTDSNAFYAYTAAASKDIGHIQKGTKAILKFSSFPHYYYGTMKASVSSISSSPTENGNYPINLFINDTGRLDQKVTKGMTGTASFIVEEMPVINYIAKSFLKAVTVD